MSDGRIGGDSHVRIHQGNLAELRRSGSINTVVDAHSAQAGEFQNPISDNRGNTVYVTDAARDYINNNTGLGAISVAADVVNHPSKFFGMIGGPESQLPKGKPELHPGRR